MKILISPRTAEKLKDKHRVTQGEVCQCFENREGGFLEDLREDHLSDPPTQWFIAETNQHRKLKVAFIKRKHLSVEQIVIRSAYEPNAEELRIYEKYGK